MAESDPHIAQKDWPAVRKRNGRIGLRKLVSIIAENRTDRAEAPLPLHKSIYTGEARNAAEMEHIFRGEPIVAGLSGDIPKPGEPSDAEVLRPATRWFSIRSAPRSWSRAARTASRAPS